MELDRLGVELRRRVGSLGGAPIGVNLFLDGGDVTSAVDQLDLTNLYWATGAGLWAQLYGGLKLRVDVGYRLNQRGADDPLRAASWWDDIAFHLGIGEAY